MTVLAVLALALAISVVTLVATPWRIHRPAHRTRDTMTVQHLGEEARVLLPATREALTAAIDELARRSIGRGLARDGRYQDMIDRGLLQPIGPRPGFEGFPDPGNPGYHLRLARDPYGLVSASGLVLLAWNPPTGHGAPTLLALGVPAGTPDPITAAAWTYDTTPAVYTQLARRT